jgi:hypothetical protein
MLDHLAYAVPHLDSAVAGLERRLGVRAAAGGKHRGLGTHNALLSLGEGAYLEVIAPDPEQPEPSQPRPFGLDQATAPALVAWCAKAPEIDERVARARDAGYDPGPVLQLGRDRPDGTSVEWRFTFPTGAGDGLVPFLIDWGESPHPSLDAPGGLTLVSLRGEHTDPDTVIPLLRALEVEMEVTKGPSRALIALLDTPNGRVELR